MIDLVIAKAAAGFDADVLALAGGLVEGADVEDAVGVDVEGDFNLGYSTWRRRDACQVEAADGLVVVGHGAFALQHVDLHLGLVVGSGREHLRFLGGNGGVGVDEPGHHTAEGLNAEAQGAKVHWTFAHRAAARPSPRL